MAEISCAEKIMKALCDCADKMLYESRGQEILLFAQSIETLSRSLEILKGSEKEGASDEVR